MSDSAKDDFRWEDLDQRLVSLKLADVAERMQKEATDATRKAALETNKSGNSGGYFARLLELQEQITDAWAKALYETYCEVWLIQGHQPTPDFIRAVSRKAVRELIGSRKGAVEESIQLYCARTRRSSGKSAALAHLTRLTYKLASKWDRRLEAEARALEY